MTQARHAPNRRGTRSRRLTHRANSTHPMLNALLETISWLILPVLLILLLGLIVLGATGHPWVALEPGLPREQGLTSSVAPVAHPDFPDGIQTHLEILRWTGTVPIGGHA
jgi:hypothetical protein